MERDLARHVADLPLQPKAAQDAVARPPAAAADVVDVRDAHAVRDSPGGLPARLDAGLPQAGDDVLLS